MQDIWIQKSFAPVKKLLPGFIWQPLRRIASGLMVPALFSIRSGHFRSALLAAPVGKDGTPLPWYCYPCIDFLSARDFSDKRILEFGGGNSTLWWAKRAASVLTFEGNEGWAERIKKDAPSNACINFVSDAETKNIRVKDSFDVVIVDGLDRGKALEIAVDVVTETGAIICDNSDRYNYQKHVPKAFSRVDFHGYVPGVVNPQATSIYFKDGCFLFSPEVLLCVD